MSENAEWRALDIRERKRILVERAGGRCVMCGFTPQNHVDYAVFDFHHRRPEEKSFRVQPGSNRTLEATLAELRKCDVLCANCHRRHHYMSDPVRKAGRPPGTGNKWRITDEGIMAELHERGVSLWEFCKQIATSRDMTPQAVWYRVKAAQQRLAKRGPTHLDRCEECRRALNVQSLDP